MSDTAIASAFRAAIAAALPGYNDWTEDPAPAGRGKLPAFAVILDRDGAVPLSMSSTLEEVTATVQVALFVKSSVGQPEAIRAAAMAARDIVAAAIKAAGDFGGLTFTRPSLGGTGVEIAGGEERIGRADLRYSVQFVA